MTLRSRLTVLAVGIGLLGSLAGGAMALGDNEAGRRNGPTVAPATSRAVPAHATNARETAPATKSSIPLNATNNPND